MEKIMKTFSKNKQKDTRPLAGLFGLKQFLVVPVAIFGLIATGANFVIASSF